MASSKNYLFHDIIGTMKKISEIHAYVWIEFEIWFILLSIVVAGIRIYRYNQAKQLSTYQIFMSDVDGLIVGSPVKYMGVQIGYISKINIVANEVYVKFIVTEEGMQLPKGSIATVEFSGLGGSKSLEIYPPDEESLATDKLIVVNSPKRLHDSLGLLNDMFDKIGSITSRLSYFAREAGLGQNSSPVPVINMEDIRKNVQTADKYVDDLAAEKAKINNKMKEWKHE